MESNGKNTPLFIVFYLDRDMMMNQEIISNYKRFKDISKVFWEDNRQFINISPSHVPSRPIAQNYQEIFGDDFGIITFDAHLDLSDSGNTHGTWITQKLAGITAVIGGWAETRRDFEEANSSFAFLEPEVESIISNREFIDWLRGKKIYISLDLDYFSRSQTNFLGYSNYWHRNKIIGHSMNLEQMFALQNNNYHSCTPNLAGKSLGFFPDLKIFAQNKKDSLKKQSDDIIIILREISKLCRQNSALLLSIDFVEYSPTCDWLQLTIKEFIGKYPTLLASLNH